MIRSASTEWWSRDGPAAGCERINKWLKGQDDHPYEVHLLRFHVLSIIGRKGVSGITEHKLLPVVEKELLLFSAVPADRHNRHFQTVAAG